MELRNIYLETDTDNLQFAKELCLLNDIQVHFIRHESQGRAEGSVTPFVHVAVSFGDEELSYVNLLIEILRKIGNANFFRYIAGILFAFTFFID